MRRIQITVPFQKLIHNTRVATCVAALVLVSGCAMFGGTPDDALSTTPVGSTAPGAEESAAAAEAAVSAATQAWRDGDPLAAMSIATRALRAGAPPEYEMQLRRIRMEAREALLSEQIAKLSVLPTFDAVADGEPVSGVVRVQNRSSAPISVARTADDSSASLVILEIVRRDFDTYGNVRTTEFTVHVTLERNLELGPGGQEDVPFTIPAESLNLTHVDFSTFEIGGHLRAVAVRVGATELFDALPFEPAIVRVFQQGYEPLADDPMDSLLRAIAKRSPPHILTSAELLSPGERAEAVEVLTAAAGEDPPLAFVCNAAAERLKSLLSGEAE